LAEEESAYEIGSPQFFASVRASLGRFPYKQRLLEEIWRDRSGNRLIEIGCGLGADLVELVHRGFNVVAVDLSLPVAKLAARHLETLDLPGSTAEADVENLPFKDGSFDAVFSSGVFQHTPDPLKAIAEAIRVLRPGGKLTTILYHRHSWFWLLSKLGRVNVEFEEEEAPIVEAYTREELQSMFGNLQDLEVCFEHYRPVRTRRSGLLACLYNAVLVPAASAVPAHLLRPFGFHAVIRGTKSPTAPRVFPKPNSGNRLRGYP
jgi:ubiquinone/menaquinone biosynthesis C-methylase UbiE